MANVYSTRFIAQQGLQGNVTYEVPAGFVAVVAQVTFYTDTLAPTEACYLKNLTVGNLLVRAFAPAVPADTPPHSEEGRWVFEPGEVMQVVGGVSLIVAWDVYVGGYLLTLP